MATKKTTTNYTARDFDSIKLELVKHAKRYYPDTYKDFSEASFGSLVLDSVAYVGDMLSFYLDYQVNELFLDSATEPDNIKKIGEHLGYRGSLNATTTSTGQANFYVIIPANSSGMGVATEYSPIVSAGATCTSNSGASFYVTEDIHFDHPNNPVVVARVNEDTGIPTHYAVQATANVVSGQIKTSKISVGAYKKFKKIKISGLNVSEIVSVVDSSGREYYEVEYLSQDTIYRDVSNRGSDSDNAPSILRPFAAARRFVVETDTAGTYLQFGHGSESELSQASVVMPINSALDFHGKNYSSARSFDPSKLMSTDKLGISPSSTTLTVKYRSNSSQNSNVPVNGLKNFVNKKTSFKNSKSLSTSKMRDVNNSIEVSNSLPIVGQVTTSGNAEIKRRMQDSYASQNRAVTRQDLESMAYGMPVKYGAIKRCNIKKSPCSMGRNLDLYVLSEGTDGKLMAATDTLKNNLKTWLSERKMISDTIDIIDAKIINYGIEFSIIVDPSKNKYEVLNSAMETLKSTFSQPLYIGEPLYITDIYSTLNKVSGVVDTKNVKIVNRTGVGYSATYVNIDNLLSADGLTVMSPDNVALEIKFPGSDINGSTL
jgi:hypothetical protein|tara:strand:- start:524 stop:2323 length:1800 start_codon:yes stop_codon:yes gene_type:complete